MALGLWEVDLCSSATLETSLCAVGPVLAAGHTPRLVTPFRSSVVLHEQG